MNPKLMAAMKAKMGQRKAKPVESMPASGSPGTPSDVMSMSSGKGTAMRAGDGKGPDYPHEQVRRHLEKGLNGTRRADKLHLKMAKYHHDCACGVTKAGGQ